MDIEAVLPELRDATRKIPRIPAAKPVARKLIRVATRVMRVPETPGVAVRTVREGRLRLRIYEPVVRKNTAGLFWIHGGGLVIGDARQDEALCAGTAAELGITIVSANYRLAPEHPFPAAHDDLLQAWNWLHDNAGALGVDSARLAVGGESAGGGLAASLVHRLHDLDGPRPIAQWLFAPMLDDRTAADRSLDAHGHWIWNNSDNRFGWASYLGHEPGADTVPPYAVPARRTDLTGLPPAFIAVGDIELFHQENLDYAQRLTEAGVPVTLDVVTGAPHGFENWANDTEPARQLLQRARAWLAEAVDPSVIRSL